MNSANGFDGLFKAGHVPEGTEFRTFLQAQIRKPVITERRASRHGLAMSTDKIPSRRAMAFKSWMKANSTNGKQVALRSGVPYSTIASFVQGDTQSLKGDTEEKLLKAFGANGAEMFGGTTVEKPSRTIPVVSWVAAGRMVEPDAQLPAEVETIEISGLAPGDYFGTRARGDSMNRIAPDGALIIVDKSDRELVRGRRYIFSSRGKTTFKRFGGPDPYRLEPESLNPENEPIFPREGEKWDVIGRVKLVVSEI